MNHLQRIKIGREELAIFCQKWMVRKLAIFGSVLRDDFGPDSDIDVLVEFEDTAPWSLWDMIAMRDELAEAFERPVDLVEKKAIRNPFRRHFILSTCKVVYDAGKV